MRFVIISDNDKLALDLIEKMNISVIKIKKSHKYGLEVDYYPVDLKHIILDLSHVENLKTPEKFLRYVEILYQKKINTILIDGAGQEAICSYVLPRLKAIIQPYFSLGGQKKPNSDFWIFGREYVIIEDIYKNSYKEKFNPKVNRILITLGGSDPQNITEQILSTLSTEIH